jgi:hypothetical protein
MMMRILLTAFHFLICYHDFEFLNFSSFISLKKAEIPAARKILFEYLENATCFHILKTWEILQLLLIFEEPKLNYILPGKYENHRIRILWKFVRFTGIFDESWKQKIPGVFQEILT